ncbi:MAG: hypothetical protein R3B07_27265 [Polyangiaceae bacterium]
MRGESRTRRDCSSDEAKKTLPFDAFQRMVKENPDEVKQVSQSLLRPSGPPRVVATVTSPNGDFALVYEDGAGGNADGSAIASGVAVAPT